MFLCYNISVKPIGRSNMKRKYINRLLLLSAAMLLGACGEDVSAPVFVSANTANVAENQTNVMTLQAIDLTTITYGIRGGDSVAFDLNISSGIVTFKEAPDFETKKVYTFIATATDTSGNEATQSVTVNVLNDACRNGDVVTHNGVDYCPVVSPDTERIWLDRNIGAQRVCVALDDVLCFGDSYQWGRNADGHEHNDSSTSNTLATQIDPVQAEVLGKFVTTTTEPYDWTANGVDNNGIIRQNKWMQTDGSSVCPVHYRVPTIDELKAEFFNARFVLENNVEAYESFLKLPTQGGRNHQNGLRYEEEGAVWSTTPEGNETMTVYYDELEADYDTIRRAETASVRCIKSD
jgi:hypothetical protein